MRKYFFTLMLVFFVTKAANAQFYTITAQKAKQIEVDDKKEVNRVEPIKIDTLDFFYQPQGRRISIEKSVPLFVNATDSLLFGLLQERMLVCLPLNFLNVTSHYGMRKDPFMKCSKFHDGIDFKCKNEYVYAMLPGVVKKVHYGNKGYGNYVELDYGNIQSLYGHLSMITVKEGDVVDAGTIVAISGNTGKTTGPHLHLRMRKNGKSVDPKPFINYMNRYISSLQEKINTVQTGERPAKPLNIANLIAAMDKYDLSNKTYVVAQAILETGYFTSRVCLELNNLFGLRRPSNGEYYAFDNWEESVKAYRDYVQYKYKGGDYLTFLNDIGYAEDKAYIYKVRSIARSLQMP